jgi:hypothetical protein
MSISLFREEALAAANYSWLGEIRIATPRSHIAMAAFGAVALATMVAVVLLGSYSRYVPVNGITTAAVQPIPETACAGKRNSTFTAASNFVPASATPNAILFVPVAIIDALHVNDHIDLHYQLYARQRPPAMRGTITSISEKPLSAFQLASLGWPAAATPLMGAAVALVVCTDATIAEKAHAVKPGTPVISDIVLERTPLLEFVLPRGARQ